MRKYDIVYILKAGSSPGELRYSLRSVEANMDHGKVWFYCGQPDGLRPDESVPSRQIGLSKWERTRYSLRQVCQNDSITKKFWLFNDDFYVMAPMEKAVVYHRGQLEDHIRSIESRRNGRRSGYSGNLRMCMDQLQAAGLTTIDYALHVPMLVDREKMLETLDMFPGCPMFRSLYGNYAKVGGKYHEDVKTVDPNKIIPEDADFFSTSNKAFAGRVLDQLKQRFPEQCKYER